MEEADALSMFKPSRYPNETADDKGGINSFGASIDHDFGSAFIPPSNEPIAAIRMKDDLVVHE